MENLETIRIFQIKSFIRKKNFKLKIFLFIRLLSSHQRYYFGHTTTGCFGGLLVGLSAKQTIPPTFKANGKRYGKFTKGRVGS